MSLLSPVQEPRGSFPGDDERQPLISGAPPPNYSDAFPGDPETEGRPARRQSVQAGASRNNSRAASTSAATSPGVSGSGAADAMDIQAVAGVESTATELHIEDTSHRARSVKG